MSLQVNLSSKDIAIAYQSILDGTDTDWMLLTYEKGSNDLKVRLLGRTCTVSLIASTRFKAKVPVVWKKSKKSFQMAGALSSSNQSVHICP